MESSQQGTPLNEVDQDYAIGTRSAFANTSPELTEECYFRNVATCPDCGGAMIRLGTCTSCPLCGFGSCGG